MKLQEFIFVNTINIMYFRNSNIKFYPSEENLDTKWSLETKFDIIENDNVI